MIKAIADEFLYNFTEEKYVRHFERFITGDFKIKAKGTLSN